MPNRVTILVIVLALLLFGSSAALAEKNWVQIQIPQLIDAYLEEMDPTLTTMEAQIAAMDAVANKKTDNYEKVFRRLVLYRTIQHAADDIVDLAPWSASSDVEDKMGMVKMIADAHYANDKEHLKHIIHVLTVTKRSQVEKIKNGKKYLVYLEQLDNSMDDLDSMIEDAYEESQYRPKTFREI